MTVVPTPVRGGGAFDGGVPDLVGRHIDLAPLRAEYVPFVAELFANPSAGFRYVLGGGTWSPDRLQLALYSDVFVQFVVRFRLTARPVGLVRCVHASFVDGRAHISTICHERYWNTGIAFEALGVFVDYLFGMFNFRKLYVEMADFNAQQFGAAIDYLTLEARLEEYRYHAGRLWDVVVASIGRHQWAAVRDDFVRKFVEPSEASANGSPREAEARAT